METQNKEKNKTYEYFKNDEFFLHGRFKDMVDQLWELNKIQNSCFKRLVDLYAIATVIGLKFNIRQPDDIRSADDKRTVQMMQITSAYYTLMPIMELVLMLDESRGLSEEDRVHSAFVIPKTMEEYKANMELFNSYSRGGIEYLYQHIIVRNPENDDEDYGNQKINNIVNLLKGHN